MREIKFRGKTKDGEWVYGNYVLNPIDGKSFILSVHETTLEQTEIIPETLGQYTGLKDCNGVEIYEGDVCKSNMLRGRSVCVVYDDVQCRFIYKARYQFDNSGVNTITRLENEIIGNIHDNPELLESNK